MAAQFSEADHKVANLQAVVSMSNVLQAGSLAQHVCPAQTPPPANPKVANIGLCTCTVTCALDRTALTWPAVLAPMTTQAANTVLCPEQHTGRQSEQCLPTTAANPLFALPEVQEAAQNQYVPIRVPVMQKAVCFDTVC